jgi:hypothetical protein
VAVILVFTIWAFVENRTYLLKSISDCTAIGQYRAREAHKINPYFSISGF